jgi:hypothetical protein
MLQWSQHRRIRAQLFPVTVTRRTSSPTATRTAAGSRSGHHSRVGSGATAQREGFSTGLSGHERSASLSRTRRSASTT